MIAIYRPWLTRLSYAVVAILSLGFVRPGRPRLPRVPHIRLLGRRLFAFAARWRGRRDGKLGIPRADEAHAPPEIWRLKQYGDGFVREIGARWAATDARLVAERVAIEREARAV